MNVAKSKTSVVQPEHIQIPTPDEETNPQVNVIETIDLRSRRPVRLFLTGWGYEKEFREGWRRLECYPIAGETILYIVYSGFGVCEAYVLTPARWTGRKAASDKIAADRGFEPQQGSEIALSLKGERTDEGGVHESYAVPGGTETLHIHQTDRKEIRVRMEADYLPF